MPAEPLRMEVPVGDWMAEAGERDPDPPEKGCGAVSYSSCTGEFPFGFGGAPYANYHTGAPAARPAARLLAPDPRRPHRARG